MAIVQIPQQAAASAKEAAHGIQNKVEQLRGIDKCWTRSAAVGSLITGAVLLAQGRRKAGIAATAVGAAFILLENPKDAKALWDSLPGHVAGGRRLLSQLDGLMDEISTQANKFRSFLDKAEM